MLPPNWASHALLNALRCPRSHARRGISARNVQHAVSPSLPGVFGRKARIQGDLKYLEGSTHMSHAVVLQVKLPDSPPGKQSRCSKRL